MLFRIIKGAVKAHERTMSLAGVTLPLSVAQKRAVINYCKFNKAVTFPALEEAEKRGWGHGGKCFIHFLSCYGEGKLEDRPVRHLRVV